MKALCIHMAALEDLPQLVELLAGAPEGGSCVDRPKLLAGMRFLLEHPELGRIFVARKDGRVLGMASVLITISTAGGGFVLMLEDLMVDQDQRNQGVGSLLLEHTVRYAIENGFLRITLLSKPLSETAWEFFRRRGFVESEMIPMRLLLAATGADSQA